MFVQVHPAETMLRGDDGYNPRDLRISSLPDGRELLIGTFRDDGRLTGQVQRPDRPFRITIPIGFEDWPFLNARLFFALRSDNGLIRINVELLR